MTQREEIIHEALKATAANLPNSIVGDLMMLFPDDVVLRFLNSFSGMVLSVPKVESVWRIYRNQVVCDTLAAKNDRPTRERLASYFGISVDKISRIYAENKNLKKRPARSSVHRAAVVAYRSKFNDIVNDARSALKRK